MKKIILNLFLLNFIIVLSVTGRDVISFNDGWSFKKGPFTKSATLLTDDQVGGSMAGSDDPTHMEC